MKGARTYKEIVRSHLPSSEDEAIPMRALAITCGLTEREIRHEIHALRDEGELICASVKGYWITDDPTELMRYYKTAKSRALSTLANLKTIRRVVKAAGIE